MACCCSTYIPDVSNKSRLNNGRSPFSTITKCERLKLLLLLLTVAIRIPIALLVHSKSFLNSFLFRYPFYFFAVVYD